MNEISFDDIDAINAVASDSFGDWGSSIVVTQEMIDNFAELTGDRQWIHIDVERATKESPFGGPVAHGFLTLSLMPKLVSMPVSLTGHGSVVNYGAESLRFLSPVPAGAEVHAAAFRGLADLVAHGDEPQRQRPLVAPLYGEPAARAVEIEGLAIDRLLGR